jgi:Rap1a immunity proteins
VYEANWNPSPKGNPRSNLHHLQCLRREVGAMKHFAIFGVLLVVLLLVGLAPVAASGSTSSFFTISNLRDQCNRGPKHNASFCRGYIAGMLDELAELPNHSGSCVEDTAGLQHQVDAVVQYLNVQKTYDPDSDGAYAINGADLGFSCRWFCTAAELRRQCTNNPNGFCAGYFAGIMDSENQTSDSDICLPAGSTLKRAIDAAAGDLNQQGDSTRVSGAQVAIPALEKAFPCR